MSMSQRTTRAHAADVEDRCEGADETISNSSEHDMEQSMDALRKVATNIVREATMRDDDDPETSLSGVSDGAAEHQSELRILEARLFAADKPLSVVQLAESLPDDVDVPELLSMLQEAYDGRGVQLVCVAGKWCFRTAEDLAYLLEKHIVEERRLSRAALETLAIISYHQPVTRAEIEEVRGVSASRGTLDALMELGWVRPRGRRRAPGKPVTYGTTEGFLVHFGLESLADLPGLAELKGAGLLDAVLPPDFRVPQPKELAALLPDELPLEDDTDDSTEQSELDLDDEELFNLLDDDSEIGDDVLKSTKRDQERP